MLLSDDYADRSDAPFPLFPNPLDADVSLDAGLQHPTDSDAFTLRVPGDGPMRIQLLPFSGDAGASAPDTPFAAGITVIDSSGATRAVSTGALPGTLAANSRGGINFDTDNMIPGDGGDTLWIDSDTPIVAAQTTYDITNQRGDGNLGQPAAGALAGAFAGIATDAGTDTRIALLNSSGEHARLRITGSELESPIILDVPARCPSRSPSRTTTCFCRAAGALSPVLCG
ncbi:MAG: hypothetical protein Q9O74_11420 [Planctomycetota bacterium]|nr:hypothetical protein [Planctomycetota bacterium]